MGASGARWGIAYRQSLKQIAPLALQHEYWSITMLNVWRDRVVEFSVVLFLPGTLEFTFLTFSVIR